MQQLFMRRPDLKNLPEMPPLPPGYALRTFQWSGEEFEGGDLGGLAVVLEKAFEDTGWTPGRVYNNFVCPESVVETFLITYQEVPVATASVRLYTERYPNSGYVHWVGVVPEHQGKKLGYVATLAVLEAFVPLGCHDAVLETDDFRLSAIQTYLNLGFLPENTHESHPERWAAVLALLRPSASSPAIPSGEERK